MEIIFQDSSTYINWCIVRRYYTMQTRQKDATGIFEDYFRYKGLLSNYGYFNQTALSAVK